MSVVVRLVGFGSCLLGAFAIGYAQAIQYATGQISGLIYAEANYVPGMAPTMVTNVSNYIAQNVTPNLNTYLGLGIALIAGGIVLVVVGERKPKSDQVKVLPKL